MAINSLALGTNNISAQLASKLDVAGGKILQVVRATDVTDRSTTSTSYVDASISVTITPQKSDSSVLLVASLNSQLIDGGGNTAQALYQITDASNNAISGAEEQVQRITASGASQVLLYNTVTMVAFATPATTSAVTYKVRFKQNSATGLTIANSVNTGQLYAIEVSA